MTIQTFELLISTGLFVLIWTIQLLHYPSFRYIDKNAFSEFAQFHSKSISIIVMPLMLTELLLVFIPMRLIFILIVLLIWASTFFIQVPCHRILAGGFNTKVIDRLINTNWIRTILWSLKLFLLLRAYPWGGV